MTTEPLDRPLPALLRLPPHRSVLPSGPGERMLGLDPDTALVVGDLSPPLAAMLDDLGGPVRTDQLVAGAVARGAEAAAADDLLHDLVDAGALIDATTVDRIALHRRRSSAVVVGSGPLAVGIVIGLLRSQIGAVHTVIDGTVRVGDLGTGLHDADVGSPRLAAIRAAVTRLVPSSRTGPPPRRLVPDLVVLADETPDPARLFGLMSDGTAHVVARLRDGVGIVGPLVLPGRSACLRCLELHRTARDESWPAVAAQLIGRRGTADQACIAATAALATAQSIAALDGAAGAGPAPPILDATLELDATAAKLVRRHWPAVPGCPCRAATR
ncbi:hypothetical protein [Pseudonocardia sp. GCM10023141]|uniref:hypothetical protein n=1 Tax=Pseudonocardia sp. GCM10023141 TaxID=3252653 RepID=UPI003615AEA5